MKQINYRAKNFKTISLCLDNSDVYILKYICDKFIIGKINRNFKTIDIKITFLK